MIFLDNVKIKPKLLTLFLVTSIVPLTFIGFFLTTWVESSLLEQAFSKLNTIQNIRKGQIEEYFEHRVTDIKTLTTSEDIQYLFKQLHAQGDRLQGEQLNMFATQRVKLLSNYIASYNYEDIYFVDSEDGNVMYEHIGSDLLGTELSSEKYTNSHINQVWKKALNTNETVISDFAPYEAADQKQMAFIAQSVFAQTGDRLGVVILRFDSNFTSNLVKSREGMGKSGESYFVGYDPKKENFQLKSNVQTMGDGKYVVGYTHHTILEYWKDALKADRKGGHNTYYDSYDNKVLVVFDKLNIEGLQWFLISKIDDFEVAEPIRNLQTKLLYLLVLLIIVIAVCAWFLSKNFTRPIIAEKEFADAISTGDFDGQLELPRKDELGDLATALNNMATNLKTIDWLKSGKEQLDNLLRGELTSSALANRCIKFYVQHLGGVLGGLYLHQGGVLKLKATYSFSDRAGNFNTFDIGEGLVGQAALEATTLFFSKIQEDAPAMNYGAGEDIPEYFVAAPIASEGDVVAVMLIGSLTPFTPEQKEFLEETLENTAVLFNASRSRKRIAALLTQAKKQRKELEESNKGLEEQTDALKASESELQAQQEELRVTNEELEEQTKALRESEAELQAQQEELRVTNEELQERTGALEEQKKKIGDQNRDLQEAQEIVKRKMDELEVSSKYKSEFLANMSHELRTPLNSILILSQLIANNKDGNLSDKQVESAGAIHSSGAELLNLINEILDLSKVEAGKVELLVEDVPIDRIETDLTRIYKEVATDKGLEFKIEQTADLPKTLETDSQRLQQVLRNLITNAFKFTSEGTVALNISNASEENLKDSPLEGEPAIAFAVKDDGIGIPQDKQTTIFEAFQQADGSTSRQYGGTGLGLSISKELTKLLGGFMALESVDGEGSTFTIFLPLNFPSQDNSQEEDASFSFSEPKQEQKPVEAIQTEPAKEKAQTTPPPETVSEVEDDRRDTTADCKSILVIEDDDKFSKVLRDFARERGFKCIIAEDGETGLHFADYYKPSAIILDIGLPGIDGWTVMERLKENSTLRHIPVHFMSASDSSMDAMRMGAIGYLTKPVSIERVEETLSKLENMINKPVSKLLLVEDDNLQRESIKELIGNGDVITTAVATGQDAYQELQKETYDCMILDLGLGDMSGFDLLEKIKGNEDLYRVPVIIYTGKDLTSEEEAKLNNYAESIIIKGAKSPERLLDESALFLHRVEADMPEEKRKMLKMVHDKEAVLNGKRLLLVDDDMRNVFALSSVLEEREIDIVIARDGIESLEKLEEHDDIDAVLMDIMMPRMDGYEAITEIRKNPQHRKLPIIALTAKAMKGDRAKCIEAGASDYLAKPVNTDKLLSMLRVWLYQ